jgi:hypothetical protein
MEEARELCSVRGGQLAHRLINERQLRPRLLILQVPMAIGLRPSGYQRTAEPDRQVPGSDDRLDVCHRPQRRVFQRRFKFCDVSRPVVQGQGRHRIWIERRRSFAAPALHGIEQVRREKWDVLLPLAQWRNPKRDGPMTSKRLFDRCRVFANEVEAGFERAWYHSRFWKELPSSPRIDNQS